MEYILKTNNITKHYKKFKALNDLNMQIPKGSIYGFVGRNGAGKTTLIRILCGLQIPTCGDFTLYGVKYTDPKITQVRKRIGSVIESPALYQDMTAEENLRQQCRVMGIPSFDEIPQLLKLVGLENTQNKKVKQFSLGMRQRLGIAVALCGNPDFLVLDEPINGLDPEGIIEIRELILKLNHEKNITVLISSHILDEMSRLATHYGFINEGKIIREMSAEELESACRKCIHLTVTDTSALAAVLDSMNISYQIIDDEHADVYAKPNITQLALSLKEKNCEIIASEEHDETLESFYISLIGGDKRD